MCGQTYASEDEKLCKNLRIEESEENKNKQKSSKILSALQGAKFRYNCLGKYDKELRT